MNERRPFDLEIRTTNFAKSVIVFCKNLPKNSITNSLIDQLVRSSGSIGANYREANDALGKKDFLQHLKISRREAKESLHWLELLREAVPTANKEIGPLMTEADELKKILSAIIIKSE